MLGLGPGCCRRPDVSQTREPGERVSWLAQAWQLHAAIGSRSAGINRMQGVLALLSWELVSMLLEVRAGMADVRGELSCLRAATTALTNQNQHKARKNFAYENSSTEGSIIDHVQTAGRATHHQCKG